jgi:hypothetical protein
VAGPDGRQTSIAYQVYVEGYTPHLYSRQSFYKRDWAQQERSKSSYYTVLYGHKVGIYYTWPGFLVRTCDYPGAKFVSTNSYAEALYQLWLSDAPTVSQLLLSTVSNLNQAVYSTKYLEPHSSTIRLSAPLRDLQLALFHCH